MTRGALTFWAVLALALTVVVAADRPTPPPKVTPQRVWRDVRAATQLIVRRGADELVVPAPGPSPEVAGLPADPQAVRELWASAESLAWRRRVPVADTAARGLAAPRFTVTLVRPGGSETIAVGAADAVTGRTWLTCGDAHCLVDSYAVAALDRSRDELRRREPFVLPEDRLDATGVLITGRDGRLELRDDPPRVATPATLALADPPRVLELLATLRRLRYQRFVDAPAVVPGASPPRPALVIAAGGVHLGVFDACPGAPDLRLVQTAALGWGCLPAGALDVLAERARDPLAWVDRALLAESPRGLTAVRLEAVGGASLALVGPDPWRAAPGASAPTVDEAAVADWFRALAEREVRAVRIAPAPATPPPGTVIVTFTRARGASIVLWLERHDASGSLVRRAGEDVVLEVAGDLGELLSPAPYRFASRELVGIDSPRWRSLAITRGGVREVVERGDALGDVRVTAPLALAADAELYATLGEALGHAEALAFVAAAPRPGDGLTPPRLRVELTADPPPAGAAAAPTRAVLDVGAARPDGTCLARATLGEVAGLVAVIDAELCQLLAQPLAARTLWSGAAVPVRVTFGASVLTRGAAGWRDARGIALPTATSDALTATLAALAAPTPLAYGPLATPRAMPLVIELDDGTRLELRVAGGEVALAGRDLRYAFPATACLVWPVGCK